MNKATATKPTQEYLEHRDLYADYAELIASLIKSLLTNAGIPYHTVDHRAKTGESCSMCRSLQGWHCAFQGIVRTPYAVWLFPLQSACGRSRQQ